MKRILLLVCFSFWFACRVSASFPSGSIDGQILVLHVYPNPATSYISFDLDKATGKGYSLEIYSFLGRKMLEQKNIPDHFTVNLSDYQRGVFVYQLRDNSGKLLETGKFQVSK